MGKIFNLDSPLMVFLGRVADLLWLNILTLLLCIPVVTAGAAFTALNYCCLKLVRGSETYITKDYFKSFKENFLQSTIIWLLCLVTGFILGLDFYIIVKSEETTSTLVIGALIVASVLYLFTLVAVFPTQSHFINTVWKTIRNAFIFSISVLPRTLVIMVCWLVPFALAYFVDALVPLALFFCFSFPTYITALLFNGVYKKFEPEENETNDDFTWSVNSDLDTDEDSEGVSEISESEDNSSN